MHAFFQFSNMAVKFGGVDEFSSINSVFYRAGCYFLGVEKFAPNNAILGDVGWDPPFIHQA